jgi:UDP-N-acetylglucosamine acyltransferase
MKIHPTAIVHPEARIAEGVIIDAYSIIGAHVTIESGTRVGPHCVIDGRTAIGRDNEIFSGAQVGVLSQDLKHNRELVGRCVVGDKNQIREHVTISASTMSSPDDDHRVTSIGDGCLLMAYSHVGHDSMVGNGVIMANCTALSGHVVVEDGANFGGLSGVHQFCVVGTLSLVGGMTAVTRDVPPYMIVKGNPGRCVGPNAVGLRRNGLKEESRRAVKNIYRIVYRSGLNTTQALHEIERAVDENPERDHFLEFVRGSLRGITSAKSLGSAAEE